MRKNAHLPFRDDLPSIGVSRLRATGAIKPDSTSVQITFGEGDDVLHRTVGVTHRHFPNGGSWSFFACPGCSLRARTLRLHDGRVVCCKCDGLYRRREVGRNDPAYFEGRIKRLETRLYGGPARLKPHKRQTIDRRARLEFSLSRALLDQRRARLQGLA